MNQSIIAQAKSFAYTHHAGQTRKQKDVPFVTHLDAVAQIVSHLTDDDNIIAAAWLHDVVEDTPVTLEQIDAAFGATIAAYVSAETEPKFNHVNETGTWKKRKLLQLKQLSAEATKNPDVLCIALGDKLANLRELNDDLQQAGPVVWTRFNATKDDEFWYYTQFRNVIATNPTLAATAEFAEYRTLIEHVWSLPADTLENE